MESSEIDRLLMFKSANFMPLTFHPAMRRVNVLFFLILVFMLLLSAASIAFAQVTKKPLELPEFKAIYVNSAYTVYLKQTNKQEVIVEADTEIFQATEIKVENGILMVNIERKPESPNKSIWAKIDDIKLSPNLKIYVRMKNVYDLQVNGSGKIVSENSIASDNLTLAVAGSGALDIDIKGTTVKTEVSGSGSITLKGYATSLDGNLSGSGSLKGFACELETAKVRISGSGSAEINVSGTLEAQVLGSGTLKHKGNTKNVSKKVYGSGTVERAY
jgi:hypothetical protein